MAAIQNGDLDEASPIKRKIAKAKSMDLEAPEHELKPKSSTKKPFTWDLAEEYLLIDGLPGERNIEQSHVDFLAREMTGGKFIMAKAGIDIAICGWDGKKRKLNGQHTSWARLEVDFDWQPLITVNVWEVGTEDDARQLYARFDRNKERSRRHVTNISLVGTPEFESVGTTVLSKLAQGYKFWKGNDPDFSKDPEAIAEALRSDKYNGVAHRCIPILKQMHLAGWQHMRRAPLFGALFETFSKFKGASEEFWQKVGDGVGIIEKGDAARWLRVFLDTHVLTPGGLGAQGKKVTTNFDLYNSCVMCFNDHKAGRLRKSVPKKVKNWVKAK